MKLTLLSDYSMRLLTHIAVNDGRLITISEAAERYGISKNHLMKVAHQLGKAGYIETIRGRSGGLRLARSGEEISIGSVVRYMEESSILVECFPGGKGGCAIVPACKLKSILAEAQEAFFQVLDKFTLSDLVSKNTALHALLIEPAE